MGDESAGAVPASELLDEIRGPAQCAEEIMTTRQEALVDTLCTIGLLLVTFGPFLVHGLLVLLGLIEPGPFY